MLWCDVPGVGEIEGEAADLDDVEGAERWTGRPSTSARNRADARLSVELTMVWFSSTVIGDTSLEAGNLQ